MSSVWGDSTAEAKVDIFRPLPDGIHRDIPFPTYLAQDRVSKTFISAVHDYSPAHALVAKEESNAMALGTAIHCVVLEPDAFRARFHRGPEDRRGLRWKHLKDEWGEGLLTADQYDLCLLLRDAIKDNPYIKKLTGSGAYREITACSTDPETGLQCRSRADAYIPGDSIMCDLKTTNDARKAAFKRTVKRFGYHVGEAHYTKTWLDAGGAPLNAFVFVVVEPEPPFALKIYELDADAVAEGEAIRAKTMLTIAECKASGVWPGYPEEPEVIGLDKWDFEETVPMGGVS